MFWCRIGSGIREIRAHKLRSFLSLFCVMIGVCSLILTLSFMEGLFESYSVMMRELGGLNKITIFNDDVPESQRFFRGISPQCNLDDVHALSSFKPEVIRVSPEISLDTVITRNGKVFRGKALGCTPEIFEVERVQADKGRLLKSFDIESSGNVIFLGALAYRDLFSPRESIEGSFVNVNGIPFEVVGKSKYYKVYPEEEEDPYGGSLPKKNKIVYIPLTTVRRKLTSKNDLTSIQIQIRDITRIRETVKAIENIMKITHRGIHNFNIETLEEYVRQFEKTKKGFMIAGFSIGGITLVIGGIGIMNLMLASITERIREIGVRKALGAWDSDIFIQFISESIMLSVLGGGLGLILSIYLIDLLKKIIVEYPPILNYSTLVIGFSFSIIMGVLAGIYPALKATYLDPIDALRYE